MNKAGGGPIKAKHGDFIPVANPHVDVAKYIDKLTKKEAKPWLGRSKIQGSEERIINRKKTTGPTRGRPQIPQGIEERKKKPKVIILSVDSKFRR